MTNIFHAISGYLNAFCCLFVAKWPLTFAKLNSIPLNRARGPLNEIYVYIYIYRKTEWQKT